MKIILFSDCHINLERPVSGRNSLEWLERAVEHAKRHFSNADLCIVLGDLADNGEVSEYRAVYKVLENMPCPCALTIGNHDRRDAFLSVFKSAKAPFIAPEPGSDGAVFAQSVVDKADWRYILLDSHKEGSEGGILSAMRLEWLSEKLNETEHKCLIFMHHPPLDIDVPSFDTIGLENKSAFLNILTGNQDRISGIFFGHCHMNIGGAIAGIPLFSVRSLVSTSLPNMWDEHFLNAPDMPPAYSVLTCKQSGILVHTIDFGYNGPLKAGHRLLSDPTDWKNYT